MNDENTYTKHILNNGLRIISVPVKGAKTITLLIIFGVGSRYEDKSINGISHFLEHMFFKGTQKYPNTLELSKVLDAVGAEYNAFTGKDLTGYYIKVGAQHIDLALDVLSEMLLHSKFDKDELEREKGVIIEEINMYEDNPMMYVEDLFEQIIYKGNSLSWEISGDRENIRSINREQMLNYKDTYYKADNAVLGVAGKVDDRIMHKIEKFFLDLQGDKTNLHKDIRNFKFPVFKSEQNILRTKLMYKKIEQFNVGIGFPSYSYFDDDIYALKLLSIILGGNMSSRLFIQVRERKGLAYFIRASVTAYQDTGNFFIQAGIDKNRLDVALRAIFEELWRIKETGVSDEELKRAKNFIDGKLDLQLEDTSNLAQWFVKQELLTREIITPEQIKIKYASIYRDDLQRVAQEIFNKDKLNVAVIGPMKEEDTLIELVNDSFSW